MKRHPLLLIAALLVSCGGSGEKADQARSGTSDAAPPATSEAPALSKGVGPVTTVDVASLDPSSAARGAEVFETSCTACHKIDERYIGPALAGVTERRAPEWILNMILNPDGMVKEDPTARALLAEYLAPMTNQNIPREDADALLAYFIQNDSTD